MPPELLDVFNRYGLPGWALIVIGGGTIVAALITSVSALTIAAINAWAAKRIAVYAAHREHRVSTSVALFERVRAIAVLAMHVRDARIRSHEELSQHTGPWLDRARQLKPPVSAFVPDRTVTRSWKFMRRTFQDLRATLRLGTSGDLESAMTTAAQLRRAANRALIGCAAAELALEGYVFEIRRSRVRARWVLRRARLRDTLATASERVRARLPKAARNIERKA